MTTPIHIEPRSAGLTDDQRATLAAVLDVLVPAGSGMPSAREVGVHSSWIDEALRLRPDLGADLLGFISAVASGVEAGTSSADVVRRVAAEDPDAFAAVGILISGAYYMDDRARDALGYPGQEERRPVDDTDQYVEMLERVIERGPVYRPTPD
ncbi:hypothetical protein AB0N29_01670 [Nocardioides sp. NPDC092400]|uniref:hypothetical protein n=1 Tax=Nocardioides sp. NPDC092400 TaxID=3155196 RepID=UPI00343F7D59